MAWRDEMTDSSRTGPPKKREDVAIPCPDRWATTLAEQAEMGGWTIPNHPVGGTPPKAAYPIPGQR
jgi:hypothetical protein